MEIFTALEPAILTTTVVRTAVIFVYAFLLLRFLGRKRLSHLTYTDLLLIISFGSAVGDVMIYGETVTRLLASMTAITVVALLVKLFDEMASHSKLAGAIIEGHALLLIDKGKIIPDALEKGDLSEESLLSHIREKEIESIDKVKKAFLEPDGEISVIPYAHRK